MIVPTASNFKFKFSEFSNVDDASIELALEEAVAACGNGDWIDDSNQTLALYYYAGHLIQTSLMRASSGTGQLIASERTPELSITYAIPPQQTTDYAVDLTLSIYGVRYLGLVARNFPAVLVVGSAMSP